MMMHPAYINDESGSVTAVVVLIMALIAFIGFYSMSGSITELNTATNDFLYKKAFYSADGAIEFGAELLEQNIASQSGFELENEDDEFLIFGSGGDGIRIESTSLAFWSKDMDSVAQPSDADRDFCFPASACDPGSDQPHINLSAGGDSAFSKGAGTAIGAGYQGKGKGLAGGGGYIAYNIFSQYIGKRDNTSTIAVQYRHVIGQE